MRPPCAERVLLPAVAVSVLLTLAWPATTAAQIVSNPAAQDELDFAGRSNLVVGSGARAFGMGGAFLARADDATAASWNPAGLSYLRRLEVSLVAVRSNANTFNRSGAGSEDSAFGLNPDFLAVAHPFELKGVSGAVQFSFQRAVSFRGDRWIRRPDNPPRHLSGTGGFDVLALGTGLQVTRRLRLGVTVNRWYNGYRQTVERLERRRSVQETDFEVAGWSANFGLIWSPVESLNLGAVGKTAFRGDVSMRRHRTDYFNDTANWPDLTENAFASDDVALDFPGAVGVGASWRPRSTLTLSADYTTTFWSRGRIRNFFLLGRTELGEDPPVPEPPDTFYAVAPYPGLDPEQRQTDTAQFRLGLEHVFLGERLRYPVRAGFFTDRQHFYDSTGSAPVYYGFTLGTGVVSGNVLFDVAWVHEWGSYAGGVRASLDQVYASVIWRLGRP